MEVVAILTRQATCRLTSALIDKNDDRLQTDEQAMPKVLQKGEYLVSDPVILQGMQTMYSIRTPGFTTILVAHHTPITEKLIHHLQSRGIETVFAEPVRYGREPLATNTAATKTIPTKSEPSEPATKDDAGEEHSTDRLVQAHQEPLDWV
ncbi:MAG: hypothetical protein H7839_09535 [Magnetococcus sp. YQC-5]